MPTRDTGPDPHQAPGSTPGGRGFPVSGAAQGFEYAPGNRVGPYALLTRLGEGGFGEVWLAERKEPIHQRVAVKLLKPGMDTRAVLARFDHERQALALMDHPNIARVFDAGSTDLGRPYFVMEHVPGEPITDYADRRRLNIRERLELLIPVCEAVQHAHSKGVIHRDLKPGNILVEDSGTTLGAIAGAGRAPGGSRGVPKVIDFGIAKAATHVFTDLTLVTERGHMIGTPEYMSPEQAAGLPDIDTRTDVYALGMILYELLVGSLPVERDDLRSAGYAELQRTIIEADPPRPSAKLSTLGPRGDALAESRRTTRPELIALLRSELEWIPLKALRRSRDERYRTPLDLADDLQRYLQGLPLKAGPESGLYRVRKFVRRNRGPVVAGSALAVALVGGLAGSLVFAAREARARDEADVQRARTQRVAEFQTSMLAQLDTSRMGRSMIESIRGEAKAVLERRGLDAEAQKAELARLDADLAGVDATQVAVGLVDQHVLTPAEAAARRDFADAPLVEASLLDALATTLTGLGLYDRALPLAQRSLDLRREHAGPEADVTIDSMSQLGLVYERKAEFDKAEPLYTQAYELSVRRFGQDHRRTTFALHNLAMFLHTSGRPSDAEPLYRRALEQSTRALGPDHSETLTTLSMLGTCLSDLGRMEDAEQLLRRAVEARTRVLGPDHPDTLRSMNNLGGHLFSWGKQADAAEILEKAASLSRVRLGDEHPETLAARQNLAGVYAELGRTDEATTIARDVLASREKLLGPSHPDTLASLANLAFSYANTGKSAEAAAIYLELVERSEPVQGKDHINTLTFVHNAGATLRNAGRYAEAEPLVLRAAERRLATLGKDHWATRMSFEAAVKLYDAWEKADPGAGAGEKLGAWNARLAELPPAKKD
jgi:eukaryotic-like serine/threonine-protein kinase